MKLQSVCTLIEDSEHKTAPRATKGYPSIRTPNIGKGRLKLEGVFLVSKETYVKWTRRAIPQANDLILAREAPVGNVAIIPDNITPCLGQRTVLIRPDADKIHPHFLCYYLLSDEIQNKMTGMSSGATVAHLNLKDIRELELTFIPKRKTQERIVSILSNYDSLIENNQRRINLLEQAAQNIYKEWFVNMRFPGHDKIAVDKETGLPKGWEQKELGEIISKLESGSRPKGGVDNSLKVGVPSIGAESIRGLGYFDYTKTKYIKRDFFLQMNKGHLKHKDILIYKDGAYIGRSTLFQDDFPFKECSINEHVFLVHASNEQLQYYLYFTLNSKVYFEKMQNLNSNAAQPGINQSKIKTLTIHIPAEELLVQFDKLVSPFVKQIYVLAKENLRLKQARDILLPRLMNQTIKV
jgi:type I restriction enzyme S subunit